MAKSRQHFCASIEMQGLTYLFIGNFLQVSYTFASLNLPLYILHIVALSYQRSTTKVVTFENFTEDHQVFVDNVILWNHIWMPTYLLAVIKVELFILVETFPLSLFQHIWVLLPEFDLLDVVFKILLPAFIDLTI